MREAGTLGAMAKTLTGDAGKYDDLSAELLRTTNASAVVLAVVGGNRGRFGMSVSVDPDKPGAVEMASGKGLAALLRTMADALDGGYPPDGIVADERYPSRR